MGKFKKLITSVRIIILIFFILLAILSINPAINPEGVAIRSIVNGTAAANAQPAFKSEPNIAPRSRELIIAINGKEITDMQEYYLQVKELRPFQNITVTTNKNSEIYKLMVQPVYKFTVLNETEEQNITEQVFDNRTNQTVNVTRIVTVPKVKKEVIGVEELGFNLYDAPTTNIRRGLDLAGGTRVLLKPENKTTPEELDLVISNIKERLNVYGLSDLVVRPTKDLSGQNYISVEIAGINKEDIVSLLGKQGKFEAKIGNDTVFIGGKNDIPYVCLSAECSGLDTRQLCRQAQEGWACTFSFSITISTDAARRQADTTKGLEVVTEQGQSYLSLPLDLYLDDEKVDSLRIAAGLKGTPVTDIQISGPGFGVTEQAAAQNALDNMKRLQTILKTGSLPVKLEIVKTDTISPVLGEKFTKNVLFIGLLSIIAVSIIIFIRYRTWIVAAPIVITMLSEALIIIGIAAFIRWNLDLAAIAGIIVALGTGVDDQIVIADETIKGDTQESLNWKDRFKRAFFIIMGAYFCTVVSMIPLFYAGAGLLRGFAITTIIGVSVGVFITRPAYAAFIQTFRKE
ncbi:MAG: hypothetical protein V1743_01805 [Nanoarchaeota archaeon]